MAFKETCTAEWAEYRAMRKALLRKYYTDEAHRQAAEKFKDMLVEKMRARAESDGAEYDARSVSFYIYSQSNDYVSFKTDEMNGDWKHTFWYTVENAKEAINELGGEVVRADWSPTQDYEVDDDVYGVVGVDAIIPKSCYEGIDAAEHPLAGYESPYIKEIENMINSCSSFENVKVSDDHSVEPNQHNAFGKIWSFDYKGKPFELQVGDFTHTKISGSMYIVELYTNPENGWGEGFKGWHGEMPTLSDILAALDNKCDR